MSHPKAELEHRSGRMPGDVRILETGFNRLKACRHGPMLYNINDLYVGRSFDLYGEFSQSETVLFRQLLRKGDIVLDVGANIGAHTVDFAQMVGPTGEVWAIEPQRIVHQTLCANIALNGLTNVRCWQVAACEREKSLYIPPVNYGRTNNFGGLRPSDSPTPSAERVVGVPLDALPLRDCRFIKLDVEGMELFALQGATQLINSFKPILYVENDRPENSAALIRCIHGLEYDLFWHTPPLFNPENFFENRENVFQGIHSINMLCIHKREKGRLRNFIPVTIPADNDDSPQSPPIAKATS